MRPKRTEYAVTLEPDGLSMAEGEAPLDPHHAWTPEHLVLLALARCTVTSLAYHARRLSVEARAGAAATGAVAPREDGSWGLVDIECRIDAELEPRPAEEPLSGLLRRAEAGCFVGASLTPKPAYHWTVNGEPAP